jgi:diguanylate cyclase (GGDEF)-like protein
LKIADRLQRGLFLIFADMDGLKKINDSYGHQEGNKAIIDTANILRETFRESDIIARMGGDEFVVMAMETTDTKPEVFNTRLQNDVQLFNNRKDRRYTLSISIGIACYDPANSCSLDDLLMKADRLMYEQKRNKGKDLSET